jgi:hypothetical protein
MKTLASVILICGGALVSSVALATTFTFKNTTDHPVNLNWIASGGWGSPHVLEKGQPIVIPTVYNSKGALNEVIFGKVGASVFNGEIIHNDALGIAASPGCDLVPPKYFSINRPKNLTFTIYKYHAAKAGVYGTRTTSSDSIGIRCEPS